MQSKTKEYIPIINIPNFSNDDKNKINGSDSLPDEVEFFYLFSEEYSIK
jgi:hypothetical protein